MWNPASYEGYTPYTGAVGVAHEIPVTLTSGTTYVLSAYIWNALDDGGTCSSSTSTACTKHADCDGDQTCEIGWARISYRPQSSWTPEACSRESARMESKKPMVSNG